MNQLDRKVEYPCIKCGRPVKVTETYDTQTSAYILIEPPICDTCSEEHRRNIYDAFRDEVNK